MKNFIDFVVDASKNQTLGEEFHSKVTAGDHKGLSTWFHSKGYEVKEAETSKLVEHKDAIKTSKLGIY